MGAIALSYPPRIRVRATAKLSAAFFHDESSIIIGGGGGVRKCNSAKKCPLGDSDVINSTAGVHSNVPCVQDVIYQFLG